MSERRSKEDHAFATFGQVSRPPNPTIEAIAARLAAATEGPWWFDEDDKVWRLHGIAARLDNPPLGETVVNKQILKAPKTDTPYAEYWPDPADADFIAHAHEDITWLIKENGRWVDAAYAATHLSLTPEGSDVPVDIVFTGELYTATCGPWSFDGTNWTAADPAALSLEVALKAFSTPTPTDTDSTS